MDGAEQNPNTWHYDDVIRAAWEEQKLRNSPEHADEQLRKCLGCVAARDGDDAAISAETFALCGDISMQNAQEALVRDTRTRSPHARQSAPGLYKPTADARYNAVVPPDCFTTLINEQTPRDARNISEKYLDAGILACVGCIITRNGGEIPANGFSVGMFANCQSNALPPTAKAINRIIALANSPLHQLPRTKTRPRFVLTEHAKYYTDNGAKPLGCQEIVGDPLPKARPPKAKPPRPPKPVKLGKTRRQIAIARWRREAIEAARAGPAPVDLTKKRAALSLPAQQKITDSFEQEQPKDVAPEEQKARRVAKESTQRAQELAMQKRVVQACAKSIPDPVAQERMVNQLHALLACDALTIRRAALNERPGVIAYQGASAWFYFSPGKRIEAELPGMQRAFFLEHGLERFIYDDPIDVAKLRQELQLQPTDNLRAIGRLVAYKLVHQLPPFEYTLPYDSGDKN